MSIRQCLATDFASEADVRAYKRAKAEGKSDHEAFAVGDNGIGCWGDLTAQTHTPMCAIPPEDMIELFGSMAKAKHQRILVVHGRRSVPCVLADRMPRRKNIRNGAGIDLNPAALIALGLDSPCKVPVEYGPIRKATPV